MTQQPAPPTPSTPALALLARYQAAPNTPLTLTEVDILRLRLAELEVELATLKRQERDANLFRLVCCAWDKLSNSAIAADGERDSFSTGTDALHAAYNLLLKEDSL